jgi:metallophosphoesterase (TIGR03767 family)
MGAAGVAAILPGNVAFGQAASAGRATPIAFEPVDPLTTLVRSLTLGDYRAPGAPYRRIAADDGWPIEVRQDLAPARQDRIATRAPIASFVHLTDLHVIDATSPAHATFLGAYPGKIAGADLSNGFRPQDTMTVHVLDAMVRRVNALAQGPVSGRPFDFAISTGDNADSRGTHELAAVLTVLNGGQASFSATGAYAGLQDDDASVPPEVYAGLWHPGAPPAGYADDTWKTIHGFPTLPGMLASAARPVAAPGLAMPWYNGFGNHDIVDAGVLPGFSGPAMLLDMLATGDQLPVAIPPSMTLADFLGALMQATSTEDVAALRDLMVMRTVPASDARRPFTRREFIRMHLNAPGPHGPHGHGFSDEHLASEQAYYRFDVADGVVGLMLDSTNPNGGPDGSLDPAQVAWLEEQLASVHGRYLDPSGTWVDTGNDDRLVILFSHHNSATFDNLAAAPGETASDRLASAGFLAVLRRFPNVILWVNGHSHQNRVWSHPDPTGNTGGLWEINTAAHVDYPQQARTIELVDNGDGTLSIFGILVDHSDPMTIDAKGEYSRAELASLSLELAANDPHLDRALRLGAPEDRNVELVIRHPLAR